MHIWSLYIALGVNLILIISIIYVFYQMRLEQMDSQKTQNFWKSCVIKLGQKLKSIIPFIQIIQKYFKR